MNAWRHFCDSALIERLGWTLVHSLWQGAAVGLFLMIVLAALRRRSANSRYLASCAAMGAIILLSLGTFVLLESTDGHKAHAQTDVPIAEAAIEPSEEQRLKDSTGTTPISIIRIDGPAPEGTAPVAPPSIVQQLPLYLRSVLPWAVAGWLAGITFFSMQLFAGWRRVLRLRTTQVLSVTGVWLARCTQIASRLGISRSIAFRQSSLVDTPMVIGWLKPVINGSVIPPGKPTYR